MRRRFPPILSYSQIKSQSPPPPQAFRWNLALERCTDGLWYFVREYSSRAAATSGAARLRNRPPRLPDGNWQFAVRAMNKPGRYGIWARNIEGPLADQDTR